MKNNDININPIGVFDSGVGGLSVLHEIHKLLPHEELIYIADSQHAPYGDRSIQHVQSRSQKIADFLLTKNIKALVVACNTATAEAVDLLREQLSIPVIGLEPAIKPGVKISKTGVIGVLATQRTIQSERLYSLTIKHAPHTKVIAQACPGLVEKVEANHLDRYDTRLLIKKYTAPLLEQNADAIILGCTHYPFLSKTIRMIVGKEIQLIETGKPVARQLQRILRQQHLFNSRNHRGMIQFYNSSDLNQHKNTMQQLWLKKIKVFSLSI
ncbi:MAG: glutamate racemase [Cocleimonas sp.]|nr:glutamate racemase [Cocleimonas sp.]